MSALTTFISAASLALAGLCFAPAALSAADAALAPTGKLRAVYISGNPAQAERNAQTGEITGVAADLARELARKHGAPLDLGPAQGVQGVIDAVRDGKADVGFLATDPSRAGPIVFSQTYLRNPQGLVTLEGAAMRAIGDIDRPGTKVATLRGDSIALWLARNKPQVTVVQLEAGGAPEIKAALQSGQADGFAGNRLRLSRLAGGGSGLRLLPGSIMGVPQAIIVKADNIAGLAAVNSFLDEVRASGFLQASITRAANGTEMEPAPFVRPAG